MVSFQFSLRPALADRDQRQQPQWWPSRRRCSASRPSATRPLRRHGEEIDGQLAELQALDAQHARLDGSGMALAAERVALALASYQAGRGDLGAVLMARREAVETRLRLIDLDAQRAALRVRLTTLIAE